MIRKPLNLSKITMGCALGLGLLIGSIPIAKAEQLSADMKGMFAAIINVSIYRGCDEAKARTSAYPEGAPNGSNSSEQRSALEKALKGQPGCNQHVSVYHFPNNPLEVKAGDVILTGGNLYDPIMCTVQAGQNIILKSPSGGSRGVKCESH